MEEENWERVARRKRWETMSNWRRGYKSRCGKEVRSFSGRIEAEDRLQQVKKENMVKKWGV